MKLLNGDCLELLKEIDDNSVDLVFCDLPYGQTSCKWDCKIDLVEMWKQFKRIRKDKHTPFFFTCSTRFGYEIIKSNEKWFRYDLVWEKTAPVGFLCARRMPMRKHEMIYVFYDNLPVYDISSHNRKFLNTREPHKETTVYGDLGIKTDHLKYEPPLPTSDMRKTKYQNLWNQVLILHTVIVRVVQLVTCMEQTMTHHYRQVCFNSKTKEENIRHRSQQL